jgi:hypothetical protein
MIKFLLCFVWAFVAIGAGLVYIMWGFDWSPMVRYAHLGAALLAAAAVFNYHGFDND